ncbi:MAG: hypothetical protein HRU76_04005 [Phycisphaeraceae bacterium]|nr:hypothetical protein [Phycisphaerales bacterium]QOJ16798.1 MAG: hypothetical protein HRU76_04005 [Phycisphaeraceae bacterium]
MTTTRAIVRRFSTPASTLWNMRHRDGVRSSIEVHAMQHTNGYHEPLPPDDEGDGDGADGSEGDGLASLSPRQQKAIIALLQEPTITKAAESSGIPVRTLHFWLDQEVFSRAYRKARREAYGQAIALAQRYTPLAVQTLANMLNDHGASTSGRVSACATMLKFARASIELDDLAARVEALERAEKERGSEPSWRRN